MPRSNHIEQAESAVRSLPASDSRLQSPGEKGPRAMSAYSRAGAAVVGLLVVALLLILAGPAVSAQIDTMVSDPDEMTLRVGIERTMAVVTATALVVPDVRFVPARNNADPQQADQLHNNYSLFDHSNSDQFPGYNDCDGWSNLVRDGWSALVAISGNFATEQGEALLASITDHWRTIGHTVHTSEYDGEFARFSRVYIDLPFSRVQLDVDWRRGTATIIGTTYCLSPEA